MFLDAFVDPQGCPAFLFSCTVCQLSGMLKVAAVEAGAVGAGAVWAGAIREGAAVGVGGAGAKARVRTRTRFSCTVQSWKWVGRLLYAIQASSFFFFLSGQSRD